MNKLTWLLVPALCGCTQLDVQRVTPDNASDVEGIRYCLPKPVLHVLPAADGNVSVEVQMVPDPAHEYAVDATALFGEYALQVSVEGGLLKEVVWTAEAEEMATGVAEAAGKVAESWLDAKAKAEADRRNAIESAEEGLAAEETELQKLQVQYDHFMAVGDEESAQAKDLEIKLQKVELAVAQQELESAQAKTYESGLEDLDLAFPDIPLGSKAGTELGAPKALLRIPATPLEIGKPGYSWSVFGGTVLAVEEGRDATTGLPTVWLRNLSPEGTRPTTDLGADQPANPAFTSAAAPSEPLRVTSKLPLVVEESGEGSVVIDVNRALLSVESGKVTDRTGPLTRDVPVQLESPRTIRFWLDKVRIPGTYTLKCTYSALGPAGRSEQGLQPIEVPLVIRPMSPPKLSLSGEFLMTVADGYWKAEVPFTGSVRDIDLDGVAVTPSLPDGLSCAVGDVKLQLRTAQGAPPGRYVARIPVLYGTEEPGQRLEWQVVLRLPRTSTRLKSSGMYLLTKADDASYYVQEIAVDGASTRITAGSLKCTLKAKDKDQECSHPLGAILTADKLELKVGEADAGEHHVSLGLDDGQVWTIRCVIVKRKG